MNLRRIMLSAVGILCVCITARAGPVTTFTDLDAFLETAGVVVELVPDNPGPYFGGESVTVDFWLQSQEGADVELRTVAFDFSETDSALTLDSTFEFDLSSVTSGAVYNVFAELPRPGIAFLPDFLTPPGFLLVLPAIDPLHIGSLALELPSMPGLYQVDALNADQPDLGMGGARFLLTNGTDWRAFDGEITGGVFDFVVIPEPGTLSLLVLGAAWLFSRATQSRRDG